MMKVVVDIILYTIPAVLVFLTAYFLLSSYFKREFNLRRLEIKANAVKEIIPIRLQAYERMTLFLERIAPSNLITRLRQGETTSKEMQIILISEVKKEFEHNMSQQIYLSKDSWDAVVLVKNELIKIINLTAASLSTTASGTDLCKAILEVYMKSNDTLPSQKAIDIIKSEVRSVYF